MCRMLWVAQYFVGAGFYVIPTYSPADHSVDNLVTSTPALFLRNWANLWTAITEVNSKLMPAPLPPKSHCTMSHESKAKAPSWTAKVASSLEQLKLGGVFNPSLLLEMLHNEGL